MTHAGRLIGLAAAVPAVTLAAGGCKLVALGHNTVRGAAGAALLNAELFAAEQARERPLRAADAEGIWADEAQATVTSHDRWSRG